VKAMDEFTRHRLSRLPGADLYMYVFDESLKAPYCNDPDVIDPELAKAIVYETLKLVSNYLEKELQ